MEAIEEQEIQETAEPEPEPEAVVDNLKDEITKDIEGRGVQLLISM